jgi:hypothetical protein
LPADGWFFQSGAALLREDFLPALDQFR